MLSNYIKKQPAKLLVVFLLMGALCVTSITIAKYFSEKEDSGILESDKMYFTSDYLKEKSEQATYYIDPAETSFSIQLFNYADALRISQDDIAFEISATNASVNTNKGTLAKASSTSLITITPENTVQDEITVTATSTSPYEKILTATFIRKKGNDYKIEDAQGNYAAVLTMICRDDGQEITIVLPADVIPDETDESITKGTDANTYTFKPSQAGIYSIALFKTESSKNYATSGEIDFANKIELQNK